VSQLRAILDELEENEDVLQLIAKLLAAFALVAAAAGLRKSYMLPRPSVLPAVKMAPNRSAFITALPPAPRLLALPAPRLVQSVIFAIAGAPVALPGPAADADASEAEECDPLPPSLLAALLVACAVMAIINRRLARRSDGVALEEIDAAQPLDVPLCPPPHPTTPPLDVPAPGGAAPAEVAVEPAAPAAAEPVAPAAAEREASPARSQVGPAFVQAAHDFQTPARERGAVSFAASPQAWTSRWPAEAATPAEARRTAVGEVPMSTLRRSERQAASARRKSLRPRKMAAL
jgi:hypothetical protein